MLSMKIQSPSNFSKNRCLWNNSLVTQGKKNTIIFQTDQQKWKQYHHQNNIHYEHHACWIKKICYHTLIWRTYWQSQLDTVDSTYWWIARFAEIFKFLKDETCSCHRVKCGPWTANRGPDNLWPANPRVWCGLGNDEGNEWGRRLWTTKLSHNVQNTQKSEFTIIII